MTSLDIARQYYTCFNTQNWEGMLSCLDPQVQHDANQGGSHTGLDYYRQFLQHMDECYRETLTNLVFMVDATGDRIACEFIVNGVYKKTDGDLPPPVAKPTPCPPGRFWKSPVVKSAG